MMPPRENMSKTLLPIAAHHLLQLEFVEAGALRFDTTLRHVKTIPFTILAQAQEGSYEIRYGNNHVTIAAGGIFFVPANTPVDITHHPGPAGHMRAQWAHVYFSYQGIVDYLSFFDIPARLPSPTCRVIDQQIRALLSLQRGSPGLEKLPSAHLAATRILDALCAIARPNAEADQRRRLQQRFLPVLEIVRTRPAAPLTIADLARTVSLSPAHFHERFREAFGLSPMQYVRHTRLDTASRLLTATDEPLAAIAESLGFADGFHFSHAFKKRFGLSPRAYRQQSTAWGT